MKRKAFFLSFLLSVCTLSMIQSAAALTLEERVALHEAGEVSKNPKALAISSNRHFIFVPGFGKEAIEFWSNTFPEVFLPLDKESVPLWFGYFTTMEEVVRNEYNGSTTRASSHVSTWRRIDENVEGLRSFIVDNYNSHHKPIILIGHSKGGAEILYTLLMHPDLMTTGMVDRVLLIQAAIGGSPLIAEDEENIGLKRWLLKNFVQYMGLHDSLHSMKPSVAQPKVQELYRQFQLKVEPSIQEKISNRVFYLRSSIKSGSEGWASYIARSVSSVNLAEMGDVRPEDHDGDVSQEGSDLGHDGFLRVEDQLLESFGVDLGVWKDDHSFLAIDGWLSGTSKEDKQRVTRALLEHILDEELFEQLPLAQLPL